MSCCDARYPIEVGNPIDVTGVSMLLGDTEADNPPSLWPAAYSRMSGAGWHWEEFDWLRV